MIDKAGNDPILVVRDLTKQYSTTVLDRVTFDLRAGEIHSLLGANGAGKSTLCRIISGLVQPTAGEMVISGEAFAPATKQAAESVGVQIIQQELNLIPTLSVAENLMLTRLPSRGGVINQRALHRRARCALDRFALEDVATETLVGSLGVGRQQMVEIAAALDLDCKILILDEPTAALSANETERLFEWLARLREQQVGIIYISHRLDEVARIADRITILRDGKLVCTQPTAELTTNAMVDLMTGRRDALAEGHRHMSFKRNRIAMRVEGLSRGELLQDVSLEVRAGERLGIAGLVGSGRTELLRAIFGADIAQVGLVQLGETSAARRFHHPSQAVAAGMVMVTEDRKQNGLLLQQSIRVNTTLCALRRDFARSGVIRRRAEEDSAESMCRKMETRCASIEQTVTTLSGGNQQKVVVGKWLTRDADVFLFDEPTRGIDVAARLRIYRLFETLARDGKALVIVSSDLDELLETCDRIVVMSAGRLVANFDRETWSHDKIMQAAFSGYIDRTGGVRGTDAVQGTGDIQGPGA
ncbi:MAG: sugar ABC transporter ATP-binding protein [Planctomycetota bacterium]|nr:sugar ABC transporter ATP-binding protein [Planctomycetota bacterium]